MITERAGTTSSSAAATGRLVDDAVLCIGELTTNALLHAGTAMDVVCEVETSGENSGVTSVETSAGGGGGGAGSGGDGGNRGNGGDGGDSGDGDGGGDAAEVGDRGGVTGVRLEVVDRAPSAAVPGGAQRPGTGQRGLGLQMVSMLCESWGVSYSHAEKGVWCRLTTAAARSPVPDGTLNETLYRQLEATEITQPRTRVDPHDSAWRTDPGATFLAEVGELLSGAFDETMVATLTGQLMVARLADWCAVWFGREDSMRLASVRHADERRIAPLRRELERDPPPCEPRYAGVPWPWPRAAGVTAAGASAGGAPTAGPGPGPGPGGFADGPAGPVGPSGAPVGRSAAPGGDAVGGGSALAFSLMAAGDCQGVLLIGRSGPVGISDRTARTVEDAARRVAQALVMARQYTRQSTISRALQSRQLPSSLGSLPGVESAIVYEPHASGQTVGGDFYDLFPAGDGRWCFLLGDVQGKDVEAMSVTGLTRHMVRLLARQGNGVPAVLGWLNAVMAEDAAEAVAAAGEGARPRFLSMVYGELVPDPAAGGARCTLASAGHPLPLRMAADGEITVVARPQLLLGIDEDTEFFADSFDLAPGDTLLCVTDGVTERRDGHRLLDDDDGLARILRDCVGMGAMAVAERVRRSVHAFSPEPVEDDLAVVVLHAAPRPASRHSGGR